MIEQKKLEMTKLRFTEGRGRKSYLEALKTKEAVIVLKTRLNMLELKSNYKGQHKDLTCESCGAEEDNTEHIFKCSSLRKVNKNSLTIQDLENPSREVARFLMEVMALRKLRNRLDAAGLDYN